MPKGLHRASAAAWEAWSVLDRHGRDVDTMGGAPLPLRVEAVSQECARYADPDAIRRLVMIIEGEVYKRRADEFLARQKAKKK